MKPSSPETPVRLRCPCGPVTAFVPWDGHRSGNPVRFHSVPAFDAATDLAIDVPGHGKVVVDIGYGGTFYAFLSAQQLGLDVCSSNTRDLVGAASAVTEAVKEQFKLHHPESEDLAFLYGTILTDGKDAFSEEPTTNICVFADQQVDRSPTGSGVTARIALQYHKGLIQLGQTRTFRSSTTGSLFTGKAVKEAKFGDYSAVVVEVSGEAFYTGTATFTVEEEDPLKYGFFFSYGKRMVGGTNRERYLKRHDGPPGSAPASSSPASGGEAAMWACRNPAVLFCRDGHPDTASEAALQGKKDAANTSL
ncbi:PREDICTED: trans-L-3-hydroxyproline dehydratase [Chaetura pelagica]|uniref:trans-L-3-hydroxyproline dehydratase n=1 Tax=Chaetura pelagica TaxID=8897 RepID=UPI000523A13F|nr:PREDICTED: trans-L-3-hydroxyproline dehydratase [Chaetura pelagica]